MYTSIQNAALSTNTQKKVKNIQTYVINYIKREIISLVLQHSCWNTQTSQNYPNLMFI